jgi:hypothetical protein
MADRYAVVEFDEYPEQEFRVRLSPVSVAAYEGIVAAFVAAAENPLQPGTAQALATEFAAVYDGDTPDVNLLLALVREWIREVRLAPLPLRRKSSDGEPSEDPTTSP